MDTVQRIEAFGNVALYKLVHNNNNNKKIMSDYKGKGKPMKFIFQSE